MGISLTELAVKGTASAVNKKIRAIKDVKDAEKLRVTYDALINEVLQEREETIQLAGTNDKTEAEVEKVKTQVAGYEQIKELISVDTLKTM